jgi:serine/threonine-protein kinase RsbW
VTESDITSTLAPLGFTRTYPATAAHVSQARRSLARVLNGYLAAHDAALCLSELGTNATVHSHSRKPGGHFTVHAAIHVGVLRVEVRDEGGPWTQPVQSRDGQHGRGLLIVAALARDWGRTGDSQTGWTVWYEMDWPSLPAATTSTTTGPHPRHPGEIPMTDSRPATAAIAQYDAENMRAIEAGLTACGLVTHLTDSRAGLDLTATLSPSGKREAEIIIDEDGFAELRYWNPPGTPPAEVTATALRVLRAAIINTSEPPAPATDPAIPTQYNAL